MLRRVVGEVGFGGVFVGFGGTLIDSGRVFAAFLSV